MALPGPAADREAPRPTRGAALVQSLVLPQEGGTPMAASVLRGAGGPQLASRSRRESLELELRQRITAAVDLQLVDADLPTLIGGEVQPDAPRLDRLDAELRAATDRCAVLL